jgi:hypothetical protein
MGLIENTKHFHIINHRSYTGYDRKKFKLKGNCDILCMGTCDLASIKPIDINPFSWFDYFSLTYNCDQIDEIISMDNAIEYLKEYINDYCVPKYLCYVIPILSQSVIINNDTSMLITENSKRVIKFLSIKKVLSDDQTELLYKKVDNLINYTSEQRIEYALTRLSTIKKITDKHNIKFLWCANGTKTSNNFYSPIIKQILDKTDCLDNYVGWIENQDILPDSSIGPITQKFIWQCFSNRIV